MVSEGLLKYKPSSLDSRAIVDESSLLLTSEQLSAVSPKALVAIFNNNDKSASPRNQEYDAAAFHATNLVQLQMENKNDIARPTTPSGKPYNAILFVNRNGGMDSYNILRRRLRRVGAGRKRY